MERRDFMTSMGSLMALGTLSTPLVGHATTGGLTPGDLSEEGLDAYMDEVSAQIRRIEATRVDPEIKHHLRQRGMPARLTKDIARMMLVGSAMRDLPPELQEQPKVQRRLLREAPRITRTVMRLTDFLKGHTEEELQAIQKRFQEDPSLGEEAISHYTRWGDRHGLPPERREQTRSFMESATWQFTHQPPRLALRECTDKIDRACANAGFRQEEWEAYLGVEDGGRDSGWGGRDSGWGSWQPGECLGSPISERSIGEYGPTARRSREETLALGLRCIGIGARAFVVGVPFTVLAFSFFPFAIPGAGLTYSGMATAFLGLMLLIGGLLTPRME